MLLELLDGAFPECNPLVELLQGLSVCAIDVCVGLLGGRYLGSVASFRLDLLATGLVPSVARCVSIKTVLEHNVDLDAGLSPLAVLPVMMVEIRAEGALPCRCRCTTLPVELGEVRGVALVGRHCRRRSGIG